MTERHRARAHPEGASWTEHPEAAGLPHFSLLVLGDEVAVEVLQRDFGHGHPLLGVVAHGEAGALARHGHHVPADAVESRNGAIGKRRRNDTTRRPEEAAVPPASSSTQTHLGGGSSRKPSS